MDNYLSDNDIQSLIQLGSGPLADIGEDVTFIDMFLESVSAFPDKVAVSDACSSLTYRELDSQSNALAGWLVEEKNVKALDFVAVTLPRVKEFVVAVLGIWKAGASYVPIDCALPPERRCLIIEDSGAKVVLDRETVSSVVCKSRPFVGNICSADGNAYMIYTSGSTGKPKGVVITHRGLANYVVSTVGINSIVSSDRISAHRSFSFDSHIEELYPTLSCGASVFIMPEEIRQEPQAIYDFIVNHNITGCYFTTRLAALMYNSYDLPVRFVGAVGEKLVGVVSGRGGVQFINTYGPTECTDHISACCLEAGREYADIPIGRPLANSVVLLIDEEGALVPRGAEGEICFVSPQIARGYWRQDDLTDEKFVECPFIPGKKMYRTGDLGRWNSEGLLEYTGRMDSQVKVRGFRVELGEIEYFALKCDSVVEAVASVCNEAIVLYYVGQCDASHLLSFLRDNLAGYMVPAFCIPLESLPLNVNGKVDRKALPVPKITEGEHVMPSTQLERELCDIVAEVLGMGDYPYTFGVTTDLISVGMMSISAMRIAVKAGHRYGRSVRMADFMAEPTVRGLSALVSDTDARDKYFAQAHPVRECYPLTASQTGLYIDWETHRGTLQYNVPYAAKVGTEDAEAFAAIVSGVLNSHPVLKVRLAAVDGEVVQRRRDDAVIKVDVVDVSCSEIAPDNPDASRGGTDNGVDGESLHRYMQSLVRPFDLFNDDLCRCAVIKNGADVYLFLDIHHIVTDGLSQVMLLGEIEDAVNGVAPRGESYTVFDYEIDVQDYALGEEYGRDGEYFRALLEGLEATSYPLSGSSGGKGRCGSVKATMDRKAVDAVCLSMGVTPGSCILSITMEVLRRITGEARPLIAAIDNGRSHSCMERSHGYFVKTLPVVYEDSPLKLQRQFLRSISHDEYPLTEMVERCGFHPQILYVYEGLLYGSRQEKHLFGDIIPLELDAVKMPVTIMVDPESGEGYVICIEYDSRMYSAQDMKRLLEGIITLSGNYAEAVLNPEVDFCGTYRPCCGGESESDFSPLLQRVPMVSAARMGRLIALGRGERSADDIDRTIVDLFREQASGTPEATAVVYGERRYSYAEIDEATDRIAMELVNRGVTRETVVGVLIGRSERMVLYPLAVMKAGGTYMPLDVRYPVERLRMMCEDACPRLLLSEDGIEADWFGGEVVRDIEDMLPDGISLPCPDGKDRFVVLFTSGSTGRPKGVELEHHSILNFCRWYVKNFEITEADRCLAYCNFSFDVHMLDLWPALTAGASVYVIPQELRMDVVALDSYMEREGISVAFLTTQIGHLFVSTMDNHSLRLLSVAGEKLMPVRKPGYRLYNGYGPTECTVFSSVYCIEDDYDSSVIGSAIGGTELYIVDYNLNLLPQGFTGELIIGGEGVGRGYIGRPDLTSERFVEIMVDGDKRRVYRTGDLVRWNEEGLLEFIGRMDTQVKIRGYRVELGEVELTASKVEGVRQAVAAVKGESIVLYYAGTASEGDIRGYLVSRLAEYMVPAVYVRMESLPLNGNGKVDRKALPAPEMEVGEVELPSTPLEKELTALVAELLGTEGRPCPFGVTTDLVTVGMTSISAMRIAVKAGHRYGRSVRMADFMAEPTVRGLASLVTDTEARDRCFAQAHPMREYYPLTASQTGLYIDWETHRDTLQYNMPAVLRVRGVEAPVLKNVIVAIVDAHPALKARFSQVDGEVVQRRRDAAPANVTVLTEELRAYAAAHATEAAPPESVNAEDGSHIPGSAPSEEAVLTGEVLRSFFASRTRPFDLLGDDLHRFEIYETGDCLYLYWDIHHIVTDGLSQGLLLRELESALSSLQGGRPHAGSNLQSTQPDEVRSAGVPSCASCVPLIEKETYTAFDYALDMEAYTRTESYGRDADYFASLIGGRECTVYPHTPRSEADGTRAAESRSVSLDVAGAKSSEACRLLGVTAGSWMLGMLLEVMRRFTREAEPMAVAISSGRVGGAMERTHGFFPCTLPVVWSGTPVGMHRQMMESISHECYPFTAMVERTHIRPEVMYVYEGQLGTDLEEGGLISWTDLAPSLDVVKVPVTVFVYPRDEGFLLTVEYDASLYGWKDMMTLLRSISTLSENYADAVLSRGAVAELPSLKDIPLLTAEEEVSLIRLGYGGADDRDTGRTVVSLFIAQAGRTPGATAVADADGRLTYGELELRSREVALWLMNEWGVRPGDNVAVMMPRVKEFLVAVMGVMRLGAAYVPVDPSYPEERRRFIVEDSEAKAVLDVDAVRSVTSVQCGASSGSNNVAASGTERDAAGAPELQAEECRSSSSSDDMTHIRSAAADLLDLSTAEGTAYVIYTSGSTGRPKGVMYPHRGLTNLMWTLVGIYGLKAGDRLAEYASFCFDMSADELYSPLIVGAEVHIVPDGIRLDLDAVAGFFVERGIKGLTMPTAVGMELLNSCDVGMETILLGGEKLLPTRRQDIRLINEYGPTECQMSHWYEVDQARTYDNIPIGRPLPDTWSLIVDGEGRLLPEGVAGELCQTGPQVAKGYYGRPELTGEKFVPCPYFDGRTMYRTGDLCRWNAEGQIEYLGRMDTQVKIRGYRVELGEVELTASKVEGVRQAVAAVKGESIVLYYAGTASEGDIRGYLVSRLAEYMVPAVYVRMESLPLNGNGKVDRKALPAPEMEVGEVELPSTPLERELTVLVAELLGTEGRPCPFGVTTDLVTVGMTSISAMRIAVKAGHRYGRSVRMADFMAEPTVRGLASLVTDTEARDRCFAQAHPMREYYPLTASQTGLYIDWETHRGTLQYNVPYAAKVVTEDAEAFAATVSRVLNSHPVLKVRLAVVDGEVVQRRRDETVINVDVVDISCSEIAPDNPDASRGGTDTGVDGESLRRYMQSLVRPFDLFNDDLCRCAVIRSGADVYLFLDIHHIVTDGLSQAMLLEEIEDAVKGVAPRGESYTAFDYAIEEKDYSGSGEYKRDGEYFGTLLEGLEATSYPVSRKSGGEGHCGSVKATVDRKAVDAVCLSMGVTPGSYILSITMEVLRRITGEDRPLIAAIDNGRSHSCMERSQGYFIRTLPVAYESDPKALHTQFISSISHEEYPLTEMVERYGFHPQILYAYEGGLGTSLEEDSFPLGTDTPKTPLGITVVPGKDNFEVFAEYDDSLYSRRDMEMLLRSIVTLSANYASSGGKVLSGVPMVTDEESLMLKRLGSGEVLDYDRSRTFVDMFVDCASKLPDAIAVVASNGSLTYGELDRQSDALAHWLTVKSGVRIGEFVVVMMPRIKEFAVAVLGIMKAGAAYVPVDPHLPEGLRHYIIDDSRSAAVLTETVMAQICGGQECHFQSKASPEGAAYMIYTSGSTGKPKGVVIPHKALTNLIHFTVKHWRLDSKSRISCHTSFSFDSSVDDMFPVLTEGGRLYIPSEEVRMDLGSLVSFLLENEITGGCYTTQLGQMLISEYPLLPLSYLDTGGEKMTVHPKCSYRVFNTYGPTEVTVNATYFEFTGDSYYDDIPIGRPLDNLYVFVCDNGDNLLPRGCRGELCIAGVQLSSGYWNRPALTAGKFVPCPFLPGEKMYRTGDLVRWNDEGLLEFIGRKDNQIKLRGFRIELGEVEGAASKVDGVRQAAVEVRDESIILYYAGTADEDGVKDSLKTCLAEYMVPSICIRMESLPLNSNGKVDRKALSRIEIKQEKEYVAPLTPQEADVCAMLSSVLDVEKVGVTDDFRTLGLTSIKAMKLALELGRYGIGRTLKDIMEAGNVARLLEGAATDAPCHWLEPCIKDKPTAVIVCGVTARHLALSHFLWMKECYNIYVVEPLFNSWPDCGSITMEEALSRYLACIGEDIPEGASLFMGFSLGGEIAYHIFRRMNKGSLIMFDTVIVEENDDSAPVIEPSLQERLIDEFVEHLGNLPLEKPDRQDYGSVTLVSADGDVLSREPNVRAWRGILPELRIVSVSCTHRQMYMTADYDGIYKSVIDENEDYTVR